MRRRWGEERDGEGSIERVRVRYVEGRRMDGSGMDSERAEGRETPRTLKRRNADYHHDPG
jgi:hypothetical protein